MSHPLLDILVSPEKNTKERRKNIFTKEDPEYKAHVYQYAKSSHDGLGPAAIIYPTGVQDILNIVDYAKIQNIGVSVRTGGHQYSGNTPFLIL